MGYYLNPSELCSMFAMPTSIADKHLQLATATQLQVIIYALRHQDLAFDAEKISDALALDKDTVADSLLYWEKAGVLKSTDTIEVAPVVAPKKVIAPAPKKPSREESAKRGLECPEIAFLLREAEIKFGRILRQNEVSTLVWLFDDQGVNLAIILMLIDFSVSEGRANIGFIEKTAVEWINSGIETIQQAEQYLVELHAKRSAWHIVETAMGLEHHSPTKKELDFAHSWVDLWGFDRTMLRSAYEICIDNKAKISMPYINKVLEGWHKDKIKSVDMIPSKEDKKTSNNKYDEYFKNARKLMFTDDDKL